MFSFMPTAVKCALSSINVEKISEIRVRARSPLGILFDGKYQLVDYPKGLTVEKADLNSTLLRLTEHSVYAFTDTIKRGYITTKFGLRVGLSGECVSENGKVSVIKDITSMCVRVPHEVKGVSKNTVDVLFKNGLKSALIISPPGIGKTTFLRDMICTLSDEYSYNILVVDERNEISGNGRFNLGKTTDVLSGCTKEFGFYAGVKSMCPQIIAVDELIDESDVKGASFAALSGAFLLATVHGNSLAAVREKQAFKCAFDNKIFASAVVLKKSEKTNSRLVSVVDI